MHVSDKRSPRILIVRLSAIGDVVHGIPVLCALRDQLPDSYLAWLVEGRAGDLLEQHEALDELVRVPRRWLKSPTAVWKLRRQLKSSQFDVTIDIQGLTKSAIAARLAGASTRIGFGGVDGRELSSALNNVLVQPTSTHVIDRNLELLTPLGIDRPEVAFRLPTYPEAAARVAADLRGAGLTQDWSVLNPGAGWPSKRWPADRFAAVARHLQQRHGLPSVVVWAGDAELKIAEQIASLSAGACRLAPPTSLVELAELCRRATIFVGSDTGPTHLAAAVGTPTIALFGPMPHERNGPYGPPHIALQRARLGGSSRMRRNASCATMLAISAELVCNSVDQLLGQRLTEAA